MDISSLNRGPSVDADLTPWDGGHPRISLKAGGASAPTDAGHKAYWAGTHRTVAPAETLARVRPLMPTMGITRIANITGLDRLGIPVVMVCRPNSRSIAVSQGKGLTLDAAKASGLMESVETFHAESITRPLVLATARELDRSHPLANIELAAPGDGEPLQYGRADSLDRGARYRWCFAALAPLRVRAHRLHVSPGSGKRVLPRQHQRPRLGQPPLGSGEPRDLRSHRTRCHNALDARQRAI